MTVFVCTRCDQSKDQLEEPPLGGELGTKIAETICVDCWGEWRKQSGNLINHHSLNLGMPEHRAELRRVMKEFLGLGA
ncbi:MAG: Fe(2+)-trafficking protein [Chloroflexi bacterium]|nr:Fe(2+)-trafficking protein [Chloroflexota bacterium]